MKKMTRKNIHRIALYFMAFVFMFSTFTATNQPVSAKSKSNCDLSYLSNQNILAYNPCGTTCSASTSTSAVITKLDGKNNGEKIYRFWVSAGFAPQQAAGITGSLHEESGYSPFRQEGSQSFPSGGWGIAQFTNDPGERGNIKAALIGSLGQELFDQYYKNDFGGPVTESSGFIPAGVPEDVNDKFLLGELNYLLGLINSYVAASNNLRTSYYKEDYQVTVPEGVSLYDYIKTLDNAGDVAKAWTYLYESPSRKLEKQTAAARAGVAEDVFKLFSGSGSGSEGCNSTASSGGLTLSEAKDFMATYSDILNGDPNNDKQYLSGACNTLIDNCVTFVSYFVKKYTDITFVTNNGGMVVNSILAKSPDLESGTIPKPLSIFSTRKGNTLCPDGLPCGHTGIVLGVDTERGKVIVGEAAYCNPGFTGAKEYNLSDWSDGSYTYIYASNHITKDLK